MLVAMVTTSMAQSYEPTETRLTSSDLNSKTEPTLIAIKNLSKTNNYWFVGNTGAAPYSAATFSDEAVFVWEPVVEGVAGMYCLKKLDGTYMTSASPTTFNSEKGSGAVFSTTNPTQSGSGDAYFNGDGDTQYDDESFFVRFVTGGKWINVQNGDDGTPVYNNGTGGWTLHNVYLVEELAESEEPAAPIPSFQQALADVTAKEVAEYPEGVSTAKEAEEAGENCGSGVVKQAVQNVKVTTPCEMTVNFQYTGGAHKLVVLGVDLVDAEGTVVAQDYHYGFTGGAAKDNTYTLDGTALAAGNYTLRYFFCHKATDHEVGNQTASITVNGLEYTITLPEGVVADPSELKSTALYTIVPRASVRGVVYANAESTHLTTTALANANSADVNQQFMFVENEGKMYLYSVGAGKFVNDEGKYLNLTTEPDHFITVEKGDGAGYMFINMNGVDKVNVSTGWNHGALADWNAADDGNNLRITYIDEASQATLDALDAIFNPAPELEALEAASTERNPLETALNGQYKVQGVKINFNEVVKKYTTDLSGDYGYILDAEGNEVAKLNKCMGGNGTNNTFATPYSATAIETPGTYKVVVKPGVILSADGTKEYKGGEFEFTVAERAVEVSPSAEDGFCWNETYNNVADFSEFVITVKYAKSDVVINNDVKATMTTGETVYEATVTVEKSGTTQYITLAFDGEFAEGRYTINVPAGLFTVDGVANEEYAKSTFTYRKPQLEITRDFDSWESYLDQVWYMPTAAMITIANAESVEVDETKVATITFGETVYTSTLNYNYDEWSNAHYIEYQFEEFFAEGFEFVKGDYTFTLPAGAYTVNGEANEKAVKTYTYGDPIVEEFTVTEVLPAPGSVLESIDAISITFSNGMAADYLPVTCGDKTYYFVSMSGVYVPVDMNTYEPIVITEPGTYTLDLSNLEGLTGEKVFTWTIGTVEPEPEPGVDYTPTYTGTVERYDRNVTAVTLNDNRYDLLTDAQSKCYVDATETVKFTVVAGSTLKAAVEHNGEWVHHAVYIDFDGDGFTAGLEEGSEWKPAGDLVAYAFYNNGGSSDKYGYNSVGTYMSEEDRHMPEIPEFTAPTEPGLYRIRFVQDWCSIDPNGDSDGKFGDFMGNGGQIIDVMLEVTVADGISEVNGENGNVKTIYDLTGRKIENITTPGIYIVNGKKVLVK